MQKPLHEPYWRLKGGQGSYLPNQFNPQLNQFNPIFSQFNPTINQFSPQFSQFSPQFSLFGYFLFFLPYLLAYFYLVISNKNKKPAKYHEQI